MNIKRIQFIFSLLLVVSYLVFVGVILAIEMSDTSNMLKGENSMMGELKILLGVLTGSVGQIINFWFNANKKAVKTA